MAASAEKLELVFTLEDQKHMTLTLDNPQAELSSETIQAAAAKIIPVLMSNAGAAAVSLKSATRVQSSRTSLI